MAAQAASSYSSPTETIRIHVAARHATVSNLHRSRNQSNYTQIIQAYNDVQEIESIVWSLKTL